MTTKEQAVLTALEDLEAAVKSISTASPKPDLRALFANIDELASQLPPETNPSLRHYLQRKSYEKARRWLLGRGAENPRGACGH